MLNTEILKKNILKQIKEKSLDLIVKEYSYYKVFQLWDKQKNKLIKSIVFYNDGTTKVLTF